MKIQDESIAPYEIWQEVSNFSVGIPKTSKDGSITLSNANYFTSLTYALLHIVKLKMVNENEVVNLNEYINKYEKIKSEILEAIKL